MHRRLFDRPPSSRRGVTLLEATVTLIVVVVVVVLAMPILGRWRERGRRIACHGNLHHLGQIIEQFRTADSAQSYPRGALYRKSDHSSGNSWWLRIMPFSDNKDFAAQWKSVPDEGDFGAPAENPNILIADGFQQTLFFCPSSPMPLMNDPARQLSAANRKLLGDRSPQGIAVPMYTAVAGGAPDARDADVSKILSQPFGRNTRDGKYGILSESGVMPVNLRMADAAVSDSKGKTIVLVEQSDYFRNDALDPPDYYDSRSAWPKGAFMGSTGDYGEPRTTAEGINGSGEARVWNVTSVRYPINSRKAIDQPGVVVDPAPLRPAKEGDPTPVQPPYPSEGYGPGHNHGIIAAHPGGAHVLMADGSAHFLNETMDLTLLLQLVTRDDGTDSNDF